MIMIFVLLFSSTPIFVSLGFASFASIIFFSDVEPMMLIQKFFGGIDKFALMSLPFFIFAANLMDTGGLSNRILKWSRALIGHVAGGAAMTTQLASMFFGALSGSAPATVMAVGKIMYPELLRSKFSPAFASGLLASAGTVALIIPPSITLIIYGAVTGVSVGRLFMAGIGAGVLYGVVSLGYIYFYARKNNLERDTKASSKEVWETTKDAGWALMVPVIILGGIYSGIFTPTESAGISAIYAMLVGLLVYKELKFKDLLKVAKESAASSAQVLIMIASAQALGWILTIGQVPQLLAQGFLQDITSPVVFLLVLNVILLIMGMFMEGGAATIILVPLIYPMVMKLGIDPVHLGIVIISNLSIGMFTPPFGINIFVTSSITKLDMVEMMPGLMRFLIIDIAALLLITYIPQISLFLPNLLN